MDDETQTSNGPATLEDAMRMLREGEQKTSNEAVGDTSVGESEEQGTVQELETQGSQEDIERESSQELPQGYGYGDSADRGHTDIGEESEGSNTQVDDVPQYDYEGMAKSYIDSVNKLAAQAANEAFRENDVSNISINDLYQRDDNGRVSFTNPDDPSRPFQSRAEAQQWCDAFNAQVKEQWNVTAREFQQQYARELEPTLRLLQFGPKYEQMDNDVRRIFDALIEGYEVKDSTGNAIGYSCNLDAELARAEKMASSMNLRSNTNTGSIAPKPAAQATGPAVDAKTSGTGNPQNTKKGPKNLEEAMKMLNEEKKKNNK